MNDGETSDETESTEGSTAPTPKARQNHNSKWTAEYLVAAELCRRGYTVAFTQGSFTPDYDLLVGTSSGRSFKIDVKGMAAPGVWLVKDKADQPDLHYILVLVPPGPKPRREDQFFILTQAEAKVLTAKYRAAHPLQRGAWSSVSWGDARLHQDRWDKLPGGDN